MEAGVGIARTEDQRGVRRPDVSIQLSRHPHIFNGIATSVKSIDLNAASYQKDAILTYRLEDFVAIGAGLRWRRLGGSINQKNRYRRSSGTISCSQGQHDRCSANCYRGSPWDSNTIQNAAGRYHHLRILSGLHAEQNVFEEEQGLFANNRQPGDSSLQNHGACHRRPCSRYRSFAPCVAEDDSKRKRLHCCID